MDQHRATMQTQFWDPGRCVRQIMFHGRRDAPKIPSWNCPTESSQVARRTGAFLATGAAPDFQAQGSKLGKRLRAHRTYLWGCPRPLQRSAFIQLFLNSVVAWIYRPNRNFYKTLISSQRSRRRGFKKRSSEAIARTTGFAESTRQHHAGVYTPA